jgi:hypothetical protein
MKPVGCVDILPAFARWPEPASRPGRRPGAGPCSMLEQIGVAHQFSRGCAPSIAQGVLCSPPLPPTTVSTQPPEDRVALLNNTIKDLRNIVEDMRRREEDLRQQRDRWHEAYLV